MIKYSALLIAFTLYIASCGPSVPRKDNPAYHTPATQAFTDSISANPEQAGYYFRRAEALSNMDMDSMALDDVQTAQKLDNKNPQYSFTIGYLLLKMNRPGEAAKALLHNLEQSSGNVNTRILLGRAYIAVQNTGAAQEQVNKILAAAPQHSGALMMQAQIKAAQKDTTAAVNALKSLLVADPRNYEASYLLADWYKNSGNAVAIGLYRQTFSLDTTNAAPLFEIGDLYEKQKQWSQAKAAYRQCISKDRDYTDAYLQIGKILLTQDSVEKALRHFNLAIDTRPGDATAYFNKGLCFEKMQQKDSAALAFRQALVFDSGLKEAAEALKRIK